MDKNFVKKLREFFVNKGITQKEIAVQLNVGPAYINKLINGKKSFGKKTAQQFQDLYGLSASWLLTGEGDMLLGDITNGDGSAQAVGHGSTATVGVDASQFIDVIKKQQEQIDRLLSILEKKK